MERQADTRFQELKEQLLSMGGFVERAIDRAAEGLDKRRDPLKVKDVYAIEDRINALHMAVDETCVNLLAQEHPFATDLRFIVSAIKMNVDLERMGDQAINIAKNLDYCDDNVTLQPRTLDELHHMVKKVKAMVRDALDAFVSRDVTLAQQVLRTDDIIDGLKNDIFHRIVAYIRQQPDCAEQGLNLILVARNLEKLGDHATNIAEEVIFVASGDDVRHRGSHSKYHS